MTTKTDDKPTTTSLVVERKHLAQALTQVMPAVAPPGTSLPILSGIRLQKDGDRLRLTATDLDIFVSTTVPADVPDGFDVAVRARVLQRLVKESAGPLRFTLPEDTDDLTLSWGRTIAILKIYPIEEWPTPPAIESGTKVVLNANDIQLVRKLANFASNDDARPILTGIRFGGKPNGAVATDSYRLAIATLEAELPEQEFLLPARVARFLPMGLLDTEECVVTIESATSSRYATLDVGEITIRTVVVDGEFPPFEKLIPATTPCRITFNVNDLRQAVRTAKVIASDATPVKIALDPDAKTASIVLAERDVGQLATTIDILSLQGEALLPANTCAFNPTYLGQLLATLNDETCTLELTDHLKPMLVREGAWTTLIMPVRVT